MCLWGVCVTGLWVPRGQKYQLPWSWSYKHYEPLMWRLGSKLGSFEGTECAFNC